MATDPPWTPGDHAPLPCGGNLLSVSIDYVEDKHIERSGHTSEDEGPQDDNNSDWRRDNSDRRRVAVTVAVAAELPRD